jgi:hypothetical protein
VCEAVSAEERICRTGGLFWSIRVDEADTSARFIHV